MATDQPLVLAYDTETTGFLAGDDPAHPDQPHLVQFAAILADLDGVERASVSVIIKPRGYTIPKKASDVHGVTTEIAERCGVPLGTAVAMFDRLIKPASYVVAHNKGFDEVVMGAAWHRHSAQLADPSPDLLTVIGDRPRHCTQALSAPIINLPPTEKMLKAGFNKPKAPKLAEAVEFFFKEDLAGAHTALADARGCLRVFLELMALGAVPS
jgi:DNA polymerase-3 subunit epsilon